MSAQEFLENKIFSEDVSVHGDSSHKADAKALWKKVLGELEIIIAPASFKMWLLKVAPGEIKENYFELICPTIYIKEVIEKKFLNLIEESLNRLGKSTYKLVCIVGETQEEAKAPQVSPGPLFEQNAFKQPTKLNREALTRSNLSPRFTFENYLMGRNNQLAYAIAQAVANDPGKAYNPFFLYSGVGLGKTHLMQAIGNKILKDRPELKIIYCTGESFTNELIESIQGGKGRGKYTSNEFRDKYRKADVLLIDDIQFIAGREATQEEFFHTFNALYMAQKQIVLTSDRPPKDFTNIEQRITSRFGSGIISDIQAPDTDMRAAILRTKRDDNKDPIPNDVIDFIAEKVKTNIRELEGAYIQVVTFAKTLGTEASIDLAAQALGQTIKEDKPRQVNLNQILKAVCKYYSVKTEDLKGKSRTKDLVIPRQVAMYLIHDMTQTPLMSIGDFLGGRDHTTIMHGVRKITEEITDLEKTRQDIANVKQLINQI